MLLESVDYACPERSLRRSAHWAPVTARPCSRAARACSTSSRTGSRASRCSSTSAGCPSCGRSSAAPTARSRSAPASPTTSSTARRGAGGHTMLAEVAGHIEDQQIRNRGTIGGNCCLGDPTNNLPPMLIALGATMNIQGATGIRAVAAEDFFFSFFSPPSSRARSCAASRSRRSRPAPASATSRWRSAATRRRSCGRRRACARTGRSRTRASCSRSSVRGRCATGMEERLRGAAPSAEAIAAASEAIGDEIEPVTDAHASADYRRRMARVLARRAVGEAIERGGGR